VSVISFSVQFSGILKFYFRILVRTPKVELSDSPRLWCMKG
jgi:hypothetical protein